MLSERPQGPFPAGGRSERGSAPRLAATLRSRFGVQQEEKGVTPQKRGRSGFTLTEILMAIGILGVGMTMVATIFPVAVDQSRRARDTTMAALCARSAVAVLRARRDRLLDPTLRSCVNRTMCLQDPQITADAGSVLPDALVAYNPSSYLYDSLNEKRNGLEKASNLRKDARLYNPSVFGYGLWADDSYVPVIFVTPIKDPYNAAGNSNGPWRVTIAVYKSQGLAPLAVAPTDSMTAFNMKIKVGNSYVNPWYLRPWNFLSTSTNEAKKMGTLRGNPGGYVMEWEGKADTTPNYRGEGYLIERVTYGATASADKAYLAIQKTAGTGPTGSIPRIDTPPPPAGAGSTVPTTWVAMPDAVIVYHTIIGE